MKSLTKIAGAILFLLSCGAAAVAGTTYDECIYALNSSASGALAMSGSVDVNAASNCGVIVDSSSASALTISGSAKLTAKYIDIVGGYSRSGSATLTPNPQTDIPLQPDPLTFLIPPSYSQCTYTNFSISGSTSTTVNPGTYCNGIKISGSANVTFNSGTYILVGGGLSVSGSGTLSGSDLTFFLTKNSTYNYGPLSVSGSASLNFSAPTSVSSPYYGILFYQDPSITNGSGSSISGSSNSTLEGVFYFPTTSLSYSGSSRSGNYLIIVANTLSLTGSVDINGNYPNSRSPLEPPVALSLNPPSAVLYPSQTQQFAATINNSSEGVTWSLNPSNLGTISSTGLYTAPSTITGQETVTVTATSQEDPTKSASATITLLPPISVSVAPPTVTLQGGQSQLFAATVANTSNTGVLGRSTQRWGRSQPADSMQLRP